MEQVMVQKITRHSLFIVPPLAAISLLFYEWLVAFNILLGGGVGLFSVRAIAWAVRKFLGKPMAQVVIMGLSFVKILLIFLVLTPLAIFGLIKPLPFVVGFTLVIAVIIREGFLASRRAAEQ